MVLPEKPIKPRKKKASPEQEIQRDIIKLLKDKGFYVFKNQQGFGSETGVADLYCIKQGVSAWIEVKAPNGRLSEAQKYFRDIILYHQGTWIEARSTNDIQTWCVNYGL